MIISLIILIIIVLVIMYLPFCEPVLELIKGPAQKTEIKARQGW